MRAIKFRAWDKENKSMTHCWDIKHIPQTVIAYLGHDSPIELMQFTGLLDKNGKEIYEGDIIEYDQQWWSSGDGKLKEVVTFNSDASYAHFSAGDWTVEPEEVEIIGNIYENPELIKD
jgi:hypothetical protein